MRRTCMHEIYLLAKRDQRVVFVGSDIGAGTLDEFKKEMPDRFLMEGISEGHLVGMMAGMALSGKIPYMNTIATFITRRCYEQVLLDAGLHNVKIRLVGSGGGSVYAPLGPTHLALEDIAITRVIPNMTVVAPCDAEEMKRLMPQTLDMPGPMYIRLAKGGDPVISRPDLPFKIGRAITLERGKDVLIISTGIATKVALDASHLLKNKGISTTVIHLHTLKPVDRETLLDAMSSARVVLSVEEHTVIGGLGSIVAEVLSEAGFRDPKKFGRIGFPDTFIHRYGSQNFLMSHYGITAEKTTDAAMRLLQNKG